MAETLAAKIATFPASVGDQQVAEALNAPDPALPKKRVRVPVALARALYMSRGFWGGIVLAAEDETKPAALRGLCVTTRDSCLHLNEFTTDDPATYASIVASVDALLAFGLIDQQTRDDLVALADAPSSWAEINNGGVPVTAGQVGDIRLAQG
jgi:hypothetical protein